MTKDLGSIKGKLCTMQCNYKRLDKSDVLQRETSTLYFISIYIFGRDETDAM